MEEELTMYYDCTYVSISSTINSIEGCVTREWLTLFDSGYERSIWIFVWQKNKKNSFDSVIWIFVGKVDEQFLNNSTSNFMYLFPSPVSPHGLKFNETKKLVSEYCFPNNNNNNDNNNMFGA